MLVLPAILCQSVLKVAQDQSGNSGVRKTYDWLRRHFFLFLHLLKHVTLDRQANSSVDVSTTVSDSCCHPMFWGLNNWPCQTVTPFKAGANYISTIIFWEDPLSCCYHLYTITTRTCSGCTVTVHLHIQYPNNHSCFVFSQVLRQFRVKHSQSSLPILPFQTKFRLSDQTYVTATPNRRKPTQLCHNNPVKVY